jgi:hypothetical protein
MITPEGGLAKHKETPGLALLNGRANGESVVRTNERMRDEAWR